MKGLNAELSILMGLSIWHTHARGVCICQMAGFYHLHQRHHLQHLPYVWTHDAAQELAVSQVTRAPGSMRCNAMFCSALQCCTGCNGLRWVAMGCSVLQCVAVCCSVLQCVAVCCRVRSRSCGESSNAYLNV